MIKDRDRRLAAQRQWYADNAEHHKANVAARNKVYKAALVAEVRALKEATPCCDCGGRFPYYVMQFDHVRGEKIGNVATLIAQRGRRKPVFEEIAKCELVCANCHAIRTWTRLSGAEGSTVV